MVYLPKFEEFRKIVEPTGMKLIEIKWKTNEHVTLSINNERELKEYVQYLNSSGLKGIFYKLYIYNPKDYMIDESWVAEEKYGEYYEQVLHLARQYNSQIPQKTSIGFSIIAIIEGVVQVTDLRNELYSLLENPEKVLENIESYDHSLSGLKEYLQERESEIYFEEVKKKEKMKKTKRVPLEQALLNDKIYLACGTKGARMMRIQELAIKLGINLNMTKTDLESYTDLLQTKITLKKKDLI